MKIQIIKKLFLLTIGLVAIFYIHACDDQSGREPQCDLQGGPGRFFVMCNKDIEGIIVGDEEKTLNGLEGIIFQLGANKEMRVNYGSDLSKKDVSFRLIAERNQPVELSVIFKDKERLKLNIPFGERHYN
jgi:hypothetical protein